MDDSNKTDTGSVGLVCSYKHCVSFTLMLQFWKELVDRRQSWKSCTKRFSIGLTAPPAMPIACMQEAP